jgi:hypothetical protein
MKQEEEIAHAAGIFMKEMHRLKVKFAIVLKYEDSEGEIRREEVADPQGFEIEAAHELIKYSKIKP